MTGAFVFSYKTLLVAFLVRRVKVLSLFFWICYSRPVAGSSRADPPFHLLNTGSSNGNNKRSSERRCNKRTTRLNKWKGHLGITRIPVAAFKWRVCKKFFFPFVLFHRPVATRIVVQLHVTWHATFIRRTASKKGKTAKRNLDLEVLRA